jgi:autotransporter translocation and assembly factor TamB
MKIRHILLASAAAAALGAQSARASEVLYNGVGFLQGTQSFSDSFTLSAPGTLTVTLGNVGWPQPLSTLDLLVSSSSGALAPSLDASTVMSATETLNVAAGNISANWFGQAASGGFNAGVYSVEIQYQATPTVPLPTSIGLFLSGLALLAWQRRAKRVSVNGNTASSSAQAA